MNSKTKAYTTVIEQKRATIAELEKRGLKTLTAAGVLLAIEEVPGSSIGEIKDRVGYPWSTVSRVVFDLANLGLIEYKKHPTDRRKTLLMPVEFQKRKRRGG